MRRTSKIQAGDSDDLWIELPLYGGVYMLFAASTLYTGDARSGMMITMLILLYGTIAGSIVVGVIAFLSILFSEE